MPDPARGTADGYLLRGRYRLIETIGTGGMSWVYRARDEVLNRDVAVKIFHASAIDETDVAKQQDEVSLLASLNHHSLVTLLDAGVAITDLDKPHIFLVMELVESADLKHKLEKGLPPRRLVAQFGYDLAEGLEYIHRRGVVHRDVKPANILIVEYEDDDVRPRAKLTDFGIATLGDARRPGDDEGVTGTAAYMSPEQARRENVGPMSDVYSLGLVLIECLTGEMAFRGGPVEAAIARLLTRPRIPDDLPLEWRELLEAMTASDPADRPAVRDVILALRQIVISEVGRHRSDGLLPFDESARLAAVRSYGILDTPADGAFDRIATIAARSLATPIAIVSIVDHDRIWFKAHHGVDVTEIGRDPGLCASAVLQDGPWLVEDARADPRTLTNPLVAGEFGLQFYLGVPLRTHDGYNLGTLCVLDFEPRAATDDDIATLNDLAALVMHELELHREARNPQGELAASAIR
jgi:tRNA A-37 threonylcarbamoyl transferase component Bud32